MCRNSLHEVTKEGYERKIRPHSWGQEYCLIIVQEHKKEVWSPAALRCSEKRLGLLGLLAVTTDPCLSHWDMTDKRGPSRALYHRTASSIIAYVGHCIRSRQGAPFRGAFNIVPRSRCSSEGLHLASHVCVAKSSHYKLLVLNGLRKPFQSCHSWQRWQRQLRWHQQPTKHNHRQNGQPVGFHCVCSLHLTSVFLHPSFSWCIVGLLIPPLGQL